MRNIVVVVCLCSLISFTLIDHPFDKVIQAQKDDSIRAKLEVFRSGGIEQPILYLKDDSTVTDSAFVIVMEDAINTAKSYLGTKHVLSGTTKEGIDCSGLLMMSLKAARVLVPHSSHEQARYGKIVPFMDSLMRGDLVFFIHSYKSASFITHSGIYLGQNKFIHASASKGVVVTDITEAYWKSKFVFGTRLR